MGAIVSRVAGRGAHSTPLDARGPVVPFYFARHEVSKLIFRTRKPFTRPWTRISASYLLDANALLYASDRSSDRHERARRFVETSAAGPEILCLAWPTLMAYLRIATDSSHLRRAAQP